MFKTLLEFKEFFKKYKKSQIYIIVFFSLSYFGIIFKPYIFGKVIDQIANGTIEYESFRNSLIFFGLLIVFDYLINIGWSYYLWRNGYLFERDMRNQIMAKLLKQRPGFFRRNSVGSIMSKSTDDVRNCGEMVSYGIMTIIEGMIFPIIIIILLLRISWLLTIIALIGFPSFVYVLYRLNRAYDRRYLEMQESFDRLNEASLEGVNSIKVVKSFIVEGLFLEKFGERASLNSDKDIERGRIVQKYMPANLVLTSILISTTILGGIFLIKMGSMTIGGLISFQMYMTYLEWPAFALSDLFVMANSSKTSIRRIKEILNYQEDVYDSKACRSLERIEDISFKNLSFSYPGQDRLVLEGVDLSIPIGKTTVIVGKTGSGKTSLIKQLLRLYNYNSGQVLINSRPIDEYCLGSISKNIAYVPQENYLFSKTVAENIDLFRGFTTDTILEATRIADFYKDLVDFPQELETMTGEQGVSLSGGQRQRIALARGIIDPKSVLVLDDVFSAVDRETEKNIIKNLKSFRSGSTNIFTSHRFSVIEDQDYIVVMEDGKISYQGYHPEVYKNSSWYREQYDRQEAGDGSGE